MSELFALSEPWILTHRGARAIDDYLRLEHPGESAGWILRDLPERRPPEGRTLGPKGRGRLAWFRRSAPAGTAR